MTTASVYYNHRTNEPDYLLIDGARADIRFTSQGVMGGDYRLRAVDMACRALGWRIMPGAPIVRQADGRGVIRIEPHHSLRPGLPDPLDALGTPRAFITIDNLGDAGSVHVDGQGAALNSDILRKRGMFPAVDEALDRLGYARVDTIRTTTKTGPTCAVQPVDKTAYAAPLPDDGTLIRMDEETARILTDMAEKLGIPADQLAGHWIRRSAQDALWRYERDNAPGYILDRTRIRGWLPDGSADLRN